MTLTDRATRHVVDRCPSCGVEHDVRVHACEACDTPLRPWCRVHGGEMGWLDGPACPLCAEDAALRRMAAAAAPAGSPARTRPPKKRPRRAGKPSTRATPLPSPPRPSRRMKHTAAALPVDDRARIDQRLIRGLLPALLVVAGGAAGGVLIAWQTTMTEQQLRLLGGLVAAFVILVACVRRADDW